MKTSLQIYIVLGVIAASFLAGCSSDRIIARTDPTQPSISLVSQGYDTWGRKWQSDMITRTNAILLSLTGTITDIDYTNREMTLRDSQGRTETFLVGKQVLRFNEAKVGDKVSLDYYLGFIAEVRKPTPEEAQNPLVVTDVVGRAGAEADPAGTLVRQIRAVVTIVGIDKAAGTVTVKSSRERYWVARVADPSRLDQVQIGDTIVLTFTEATAVSLKPAGD